MGMLIFTALHCNQSDWNSLYYNMTHYAIGPVYYSAIHCIALYCTLSLSLLHCTALHCTLLHSNALYCTVQPFPAATEAVSWQARVPIWQQETGLCSAVVQWSSSALYTVHCTLYTVQCTLYSEQFRENTLLCSLLPCSVVKERCVQCVLYLGQTQGQQCNNPKLPSNEKAAG